MRISITNAQQLVLEVAAQKQSINPLLHLEIYYEK